MPLWMLLELTNCAPLSIQTLLWLPHKLQPTTLSLLMQHIWNLGLTHVWHFLTTQSFWCGLPSERSMKPRNWSSFAISTFSIRYRLSNVPLPILSRKPCLNISASTLQDPWASFPLYMHPWIVNHLSLFFLGDTVGTSLGIDPVDWNRVWSSVANYSFNTATLETSV